MDGDLLLIFGFVLTILLIVLTFGTVAGQRSREHKLKKLEVEARIEEAKAQQLRFQKGDYSKIEQRVQVLERIATDDNPTLTQQIEQLRDLQDSDRSLAPQETAR